MSAENRLTFTSWDGTPLSYRDFGNPKGAGTLIFTNGLLTDETYWMFLHRDLEVDWRILNFDLRGHGYSGSPEDPTHIRVEDSARDIAALLDHLGIQKAHIVGFSLGVQIVLEFYRQFPERALALMLYLGPFENPLATLYHLPVPTSVWELGLTFLADRVPVVTSKAWHGVFHLPIVHPVARLSGSTAAPYWLMKGFYEHQTKADIPTCLRMARASTRHSARDLLPAIRVPTLVVAGEKDTFCPPALSQYMRDQIPGCTYLLLRGGTHTTLLEQPLEVGRTTRRFLLEHPVSG